MQHCSAPVAKKAGKDCISGRESQETSAGARSGPRVATFSGPLPLRTSVSTLRTRKLQGALRDFQRLTSSGPVPCSAELHRLAKPAAPFLRRPRKRGLVGAGCQEDTRSGHRSIPLGDRLVFHTSCPTSVKGVWKAQPTKVSATNSDRDYGSCSEPPRALGAAHGRPHGGGDLLRVPSSGIFAESVVPTPPEARSPERCSKVLGSGDRRARRNGHANLEQDRHNRRNYNYGCSRLDRPPVCSTVADGQSRESAFLARPGSSQRYVPSCLPGCRPPPGVVPLHASSRRSLARSSPQAAQLRRNKAPRAVAHRFKREEICESSCSATVLAPVPNSDRRVRKTSAGQPPEYNFGEVFRRDLGGGTVHAAKDKEEADLVVELMAGTRRMAAAAVRKRWHGISFDNADCDDEDVLTLCFAPCLAKLCRQHRDRIRCIWFGLMCASWSRARRNRSGKPGWPSPLRDKHHVLGLASLVFFR